MGRLNAGLQFPAFFLPGQTGDTGLPDTLQQTLAELLRIGSRPFLPGEHQAAKPLLLHSNNPFLLRVPADCFFCLDKMGMIASEFVHGQGRCQKNTSLFFATMQFGSDQQFGLAEMITNRQDCPLPGSEQMLCTARFFMGDPVRIGAGQKVARCACLT